MARLLNRQVLKNHNLQPQSSTTSGKKTSLPNEKPASQNSQQTKPSVQPANPKEPLVSGDVEEPSQSEESPSEVEEPSKSEETPSQLKLSNQAEESQVE